MCGICGVVGIFDKRKSLDLAHRMCETIKHRGPDEEGIFVDDGIIMGMRRLSIIDLKGGNQPIFNEDKTIAIVYNGEAYNFQELKVKLEAKGHKFYSHTDTEVIVHLYEEYGVECLQYLRGMFAFAIWDIKNRYLFIARDRVGIKPLFYSFKDSIFIFASEIKAMMASSIIEKELDYKSLYRYLTDNYISGERSIYKGIKRLLPGHYLIYRDNKIIIKQYWDLKISIRNDLSEKQFCTALIDKLKESIKLRLISDVPLGAFLSGGIDSSAVVSLMSQVMNRPVETFSIGFDEPDFNELGYARIISNKFGTNHHELIVKPSMVELIQTLVNYYDEPFGDASSIPTFLVSRFAREKVKVVLSGDGGDELFAGYTRYLIYKKENLFRGIPQIIRRNIFPLAAKILPYGKRGKKLLQRLSLPFSQAYIKRIMVFDDEALNNICSRQLIDKADDLSRMDEAVEIMNQANSGGFNSILYYDVKTYLAEDILTKVDRMSMANSLEARVPILDHKFMEFAFTIPFKYKLRGYESKYIFKQALKDLVPAEILNRGKRGFGLPLARWIRNDLKEMVFDILSPSALGSCGLFNTDSIQKIVRQHMKCQRDYSGIIWSLMVLKIWLDKNGK